MHRPVQKKNEWNKSGKYIYHDAKSYHLLGWVFFWVDIAAVASTHHAPRLIVPFPFIVTVQLLSTWIEKRIVQKEMDTKQ